jgi:hypothetical protein
MLRRAGRRRVDGSAGGHALRLCGQAGVVHRQNAVRALRCGVIRSSAECRLMVMVNGIAAVYCRRHHNGRTTCLASGAKLWKKACTSNPAENRGGSAYRM